MATAEDTRAAEWRAQQTRRAAYVVANQKRLRGSPTARRDLEEQWAPVINRTRDEPTEDTFNG